jgi:hypothetical protein
MLGDFVTQFLLYRGPILLDAELGQYPGYVSRPVLQCLEQVSLCVFTVLDGLVAKADVVVCDCELVVEVDCLLEVEDGTVKVTQLDVAAAPEERQLRGGGQSLHHAQGLQDVVAVV